MNGAPSGDRGAIARVPIELNNYPHLALGVRVTFSWAPFYVPDELGGGALVYQTEQLQRLDEEVSIDVRLTQQNITATGIHHLRNIQGSRQINFHPLPSPFFFRGANNLQVILTRLQDYPEIPNPQQPDNPFRILPRAFVTLVAVSLVDDLVPASAPPSTMDPRRLQAWMEARGLRAPVV